MPIGWLDYTNLVEPCRANFTSTNSAPKKLSHACLFSTSLYVLSMNSPKRKHWNSRFLRTGEKLYARKSENPAGPAESLSDHRPFDCGCADGRDGAHKPYD